MANVTLVGADGQTERGITGQPLSVLAAGGSSMTPAPLSSIGIGSYHKLISAATTNGTNVKNSAGSLQAGVLTNYTTSVRYVKFYAKASAPTVGTDTPIMTIPIPPAAASGASNVYLGDVLGPYGLKFLLGIGYGITGGLADGDTTAVGAGDVSVSLGYT